MYEYFKGMITLINPYYIVMEVNGIGYQLAVANPFRYVAQQEEMTVYVYQVVREDAILLYGFKTFEEKRLFIKLISVSGIGPKSALAIMAGEEHVGLVNAIETENVTYLTKFPGVGKKTAQQMILDLKGKLDDLIIAELKDEPTMASLDLFGTQSDTSHFFEEAMEALTALGYSPRELKRIEKELSSEHLETTDAYLRRGLNLLMKK